jgi:catechol 2,3-dioxygenase-like lactoylglutathione lyase family enzyme
MKPHVSAITLGVRDVNRAKQFYSEGLGWPIEQDHGEFVSFSPSNGSSALALYRWDALAADAGVPADGSGFRGITLSYIVRSDERVDAVLVEAERAGGKIARPAQRAPWGGYFGYFTDRDGYLWKVAAGAGPSAAE